MTTMLSSTDSFSPDNFFTGSEPVETTEVEFKVGQNVAAREVIAIETATGQAVTFAEGGSGGAEIAVYIAAYAVDATGASTKAQVYKAGSFNPDLLVFSGTPSDAQKAGMFAGTPISLQTPQK